MMCAENLIETGYNYAYDISNNGLVVGVLGVDYRNNQAFRWLDGNSNYIVDPGEAAYLPVPPKHPLQMYASSIAYGCNDKMMAVGKSDFDDNGTFCVRACVWDISKNTYTILGTLGGPDSSARGISDSNYVVGYSTCADGNLKHGFVWIDSDADGIWQSGEMIEVPTFGGKNSYGYDINKKGHVVGNAYDANEKSRAFIWTDSNGNGRCEADEMTNIEPNNGCIASSAVAVNDYDQVVGQAQYYPNAYYGRRAFYWDRNTGMVDLFELVCNRGDWSYLILANDISNNGLIVGQGRKINNAYHAFLLIPELNYGDINCDTAVDFSDYAELAGQWLLTKLNTDIYPGGGDGITNLREYAILANAWGGNYPFWPYNDIVDFNYDNVIDMNDLAFLADEYMQQGCYSGDIAPLPAGDNMVDIEDFSIIAQQWLEVRP
jgi:probable HAF family extracellular repeat protein